MIFSSSFAAGYVFAYNTQPYFNSVGESKEDIAKYMGWIPIVGGTLSVAVGGFISDRVVKGRGIYARVAVIIISLVSLLGIQIGHRNFLQSVYQENMDPIFLMSLP